MRAASARTRSSFAEGGAALSWRQLGLIFATCLALTGASSRPVAAGDDDWITRREPVPPRVEIRKARYAPLEASGAIRRPTRFEAWTWNEGASRRYRSPLWPGYISQVWF